jgi:hypothetical protein
MTFINTDGLSFLGPGSEWFWTAVSAVALVATLIAIYRQVLLQRGLKEAQQFEELIQEWESERFLRSRRTIALTLQEGGDQEPLAATGRIGDTSGTSWAVSSGPVMWAGGRSQHSGLTSS